LIAECGIDVLFIVRFDEAFARLLPEEFIQRYLIDGLRARSVCVGGNFNFGYQQRGTIQTLRQFASHFEIIEVPPVRVRGVIVSSSLIRKLIADGNVTLACRMLGRWFEIEGRIVPGAQRGRTMQVPTLNLQTDNELIPKMGVYVSRISMDDGSFLNAVTNVGIRPTFNETDLTIETFVLNQSVPGSPAKARLEFLRRLREERKFASPDELRHQIGIDVARAQEFFRRLGDRN